MMSENATIPGDNTAGPIKKGGRHCSVRPPNNQTNQPLSLKRLPGGKTKNPPGSGNRTHLYDSKYRDNVQIIFANLFPALPAPGFHPYHAL